MVNLPKKVQTPHEELANIFAQLELKYSHEELFPKLQGLVAEKWREDSLPAILTGWHLLNGSGLNATERSAIISTAAIRLGKDAHLEAIDLPTMEKALELVWPDGELAERDDKVDRKESKSKHRSRDRGLLICSSESSGPESEVAAQLHPESEWL